MKKQFSILAPPHWLTCKPSIYCLVLISIMTGILFFMPVRADAQLCNPSGNLVQNGDFEQYDLNPPACPSGTVNDAFNRGCVPFWIAPENSSTYRANSNDPNDLNNDPDGNASACLGVGLFGKRLDCSASQSHNR